MRWKKEREEEIRGTEIGQGGQDVHDDGDDGVG